MATDSTLINIALAMNLEERSIVELRGFAETAKQAAVCDMGKICSSGNRPWDPYVTFFNGDLYKGCMTDLKQFAVWADHENPPMVMATKLWPYIEHLITAREKLERERAQTERDRYRRYLEVVRKMPLGQITDELIDNELAAKKARSRPRVATFVPHPTGRQS